jgi:hypothetical protein
MGRDATIRRIRRSFRRSGLLLPTFGDDYPTIRRRTLYRMILATCGRGALVDLREREQRRAAAIRRHDDRKIRHIRSGRTCRAGLSGPPNALRGATSRSLRVAEHREAESAYWGRRVLSGKIPKRRPGSPPPVSKAIRRARAIRDKRALLRRLSHPLARIGVVRDARNTDATPGVLTIARR